MYLQRLQDSLVDSFVPWLDNPSIQGGEGFEDMLMSQHKILVSGRSGTDVYQGASRREVGVPTGYVVSPGVFRNIFQAENSIVTFAFRYDQHLKDDITPQIRENIKVFLESRGDSPAEPTERTVDHMPFASSSAQRFELPRLGKRILTGAKFYEHYVVAIYPRSKDVPAIVEAMAEVMGEIKNFSQKEKTPENINQIVHLLAEYVYLACHGHIFSGANFSIVMGQANYILGEWGLRGISHSNLDYLALAAPFEILENHFRKDIREANSQTPSIDINTPSEYEKWENKTILAHSSHVGDTLYWMGDPIGIEGQRLEGIFLPTFPNRGVKLLAKAHLSMTGDTDWIEGGQFLGTRGQSRAIEGISMKLEGPESHKYRIRYRTRSLSAGYSQTAENGEFAGTRGNSDPISQLQIWLEPVNSDN